MLTDLLVGLVLDGRGRDRDEGTEVLVALRQVLVPEDRDVRLRGRTEVAQGLQQTEGGLGDQGATVLTEAGVGPGGPVGVAGEDLVVVDGAQEAGDAQLHDDVVDELLGAGLVDDPVAQVPLEVDVQEAGESADAHRSTVLGLHGSQVGEVGPLDRLVGVLGRAGDVVAVGLSHDLELLERLDLLGVLLAVAGPVLGEGLVRYGVLGLLLLLDEEVDAVERHAAVVTDDAATAVGVGQTGDDVARARRADARGVDVEDGVVVGLAVAGEDLLDLGVDLLARLLDGGLHHAPAAVGHHGATQRGIRLQTNDDVIVLADVAGRECVDVGGGVGVDVEDADLALLGEVVLLQGVPQTQGLVRGVGEE